MSSSIPSFRLELISVDSGYEQAVGERAHELQRGVEVYITGTIALS